MNEIKNKQKHNWNLFSKYIGEKTKCRNCFLSDKRKYIKLIRFITFLLLCYLHLMRHSFSVCRCFGDELP